MDLEEIKELIDTTPEELMEDKLVDMTASKPEPGDEEEDVEEAVPENKLTLDSLAERFRLFKMAFEFFYNPNPSMIQALKLKQTVEGGLVPYRNSFREMEKQKKTEIISHFCKVSPSIPFSPASPPTSSSSSASATPERASPTCPCFLLNPLNIKAMKMQIHFHLMNNN